MSSSKFASQKLVDFSRRHSAVTSLIAVGAGMMACVVWLMLVSVSNPRIYASQNNWLIAVAIFALIVFASLEKLVRHEADWSERERHSNAEWDVHLNGVWIGSMQDSDVVAIHKDVFLNSYSYLEQLKAIGKGITRIADYTVLLVPVVVFWLVVIAAIGDKTFTTDAVTFLNQLSHATHAQWIGLLVPFIGAVSFVILIMSFLVGFPCKNVFADTLSDRIRRHLSCAATGRATLHKKVSEPATLTS
jgi:hypothetical protein